MYCGLYSGWFQGPYIREYRRTSKFSYPLQSSLHTWSQSKKGWYQFGKNSIDYHSIIKMWMQVALPIWHIHAHPQQHFQAWHLYRWHLDSEERSRPRQHKQCRTWWCIHPNSLWNSMHKVDLNVLCRQMQNISLKIALCWKLGKGNTREGQ